MKKALNAWSVEGSLSWEGMFEAVARAGFDGIELNVDGPGSSHALSLESTEADYAMIRALSEKYHLPVVSISTSLGGGMTGIPEKWDSARKLIRKQIEAAKALGATGILIPPGGMGPDITLKQARENNLTFFKSMKDEIEASGIIVGLENVWNGFFLSPYDMTSLLEEIGSEYIRAYFDAGNMLAFSVSEYWAEILGKWVAFVHVKDFKRAHGVNSGGTWEDVTHGSANWQAIIPALRAGGFDGYLTGEVFRADNDMAWDDYYAKVSGEIGTVIGY